MSTAVSIELWRLALLCFAGAGLAAVATMDAARVLLARGRIAPGRWPLMIGVAAWLAVGSAALYHASGFGVLDAARLLTSPTNQPRPQDAPRPTPAAHETPANAPAGSRHGSAAAGWVR